MGRVSAFAPGRTEIAGNHTDHQGGRVVAAAVSCGVRMTVAPKPGTRALVQSAGFAPFEVDLADAMPCADERGTTRALVRGVVAGLRERGVPVGGFEVHAESTVPPGGGLSSSAAFELALAAALCELAGRDAPDLGPVELARVGQAAERDFFGKPCGLMDQLAVAVGGIAAMDFADGAAPSVERLPFDFEGAGYALCLVDTHCDHSRYTDEYAQVPADMAAVARLMGADRLSQVAEGAFLDRLPDVRAQLGDAAALRGLHYFNEMRLVDERVAALRAGDVGAFLDATRRSGASSAQYLQNVSCAGDLDQPAMVALALCDLLVGPEGACRIHGGGFGGSIQAFVPADRADRFAREVDRRLSAGSCVRYAVGGEGVGASWC